MKTKNALIRLILLSIIALVAVDVLVSMTIAPSRFHPSENKLENYFSYGASTYRKLEYFIGDNDKDASSIVKAGWNESLPPRQASKKENCSVTVTVLGMSFSNRVAKHLAEHNPCYAIRSITGPGAPLSHSVYMFDRFYGEDDSDVFVLGILASSLSKITTMAHFNSAFEYPGAHLYPRYRFENGELLSTGVAAHSLSKFRDVLNDKQRLSELLDSLKKNDAYFNQWVFSYSWMDYSNTLKLLRRSYAQNHIRNVVARHFNNGQFTNTDHLIDISNALVERFVQRAREQGKEPIVVLFNNRGYTGALDAVLSEKLTQLNVKYISSTNLIDSNNLQNFLQDGHFIESNDLILAKELDKLIAVDPTVASRKN